MTRYGRAVQLTCWRPPRAVVSSYFSTVPVDALIIRGGEADQHRVQFSIEKTGRGEPNKCEVTITNLARGTRNELARKPLVVKLDAGYRGATLRHLFTGDLRTGTPERSETEIDFKMQLGEGDRAYRYARADKSYAGGVRVIDVVRDVARTMGLDVTEAAAGSAIATLTTKQIAAGLTLSGPSRDELTRQLAPYGFHWSVQNGQLQILRDTGVREDRAWVLKAGPEGTGVIGSPVWNTPEKGTTRTLTIEHMLFPEIQPGGKLALESADVNGIFRVVKVGHVGDTHGPDWTTTIECKQL